jgi:hypothetical protein
VQYLFGPVMKAWADSGLPEAGDRIEELYDAIRKRLANRGEENTAPIVFINPIIDNIRLRFYTSRGEMERCEAILTDMRQHAEERGSGLARLSFPCLALLVFGYAVKVGRPDTAEAVVMDQMVPRFYAKRSEHRAAMARSIFSVLSSYRACVYPWKASKERMKWAVTRATEFVYRLDKMSMLDMDSRSRGKSPISRFFGFET